MKYVVLKHHTKMPLVVLGLMISHDELAAPFQAQGYRAMSAGFLRIILVTDAGGTVVGKLETFGYSTSLRLTPDVRDADLIAAMHAATLKTAPAAATALPPVSVPRTENDSQQTMP